MANTVVVLGAGASRSVSYSHLGGSLSPLDADFFDLLERLGNLEKNQEDSRQWVLDNVNRLSPDSRESLEKSFYTLHLRALMAKHLGLPNESLESKVVRSFVTCIDATLRAAHGTNVCENHRRLLEGLGSCDAILSFNYDLVVDRALQSSGQVERSPFGPWVYGLEAPPQEYLKPLLLKLHGSSNWGRKGNQLYVRTQGWSDFHASPGYRALKGGKDTSFAVFLPFWEKRVERQPWLTLWNRAGHALRSATRLIVWGYSLPQTDVRTEQLFSLCLADRKIDLCVIDPSAATKARWRALVRKARYWSYNNIADYLNEPPMGWQSALPRSTV